MQCSKWWRGQTSGIRLQKSNILFSLFEGCITGVVGQGGCSGTQPRFVAQVEGENGTFLVDGKHGRRQTDAILKERNARVC